MRGARCRWLLPLLLALLVVPAAGCTRAVAGVPSAAPRDTSPTAIATPTAPAAPAVLQPDVLADECLLDARQLAALLGRPVRAPTQSVVRRGDGSRSSGCHAGAAKGDPAPSAAINVYRVRTGTPAQFVSAGALRGRQLAGIGEAAAVFATATGPTLQVASPRFVVTVAVQGRAPDDAAWRAAARAALARLPG